MSDIFSFINNKVLEAEIKYESKAPKRERLKAKDIDELPQIACCGNCANISFHGIMEVKMEFGDCEAYKLSERFCTRPSSPPCQFWSKRSANLMINERAYSREVMSKLIPLNAKVQGKCIEITDDGFEEVKKVKRPKELNKPAKRTAAEALALLGFGQSEDEDDASVITITEDEDDA